MSVTLAWLHPRSTLALALALLCALAVGGWAQAIDKTAATVRLHRMDVITQRQLRNHVELVEGRTGQPVPATQRRQLLDLLIGERLLDQDAGNFNVVVTPAEVTARIDELRTQHGQQLNLGRALTDVEYRVIVAQQGLEWDMYLEELRKGMIQQRYIARLSPASMQGIAAPTGQEIAEFYEANKTNLFVQPDMVQFRHIYVDTRTLEPSAREQARQKADGILRDLRNGASFDQLVVDKSEDDASRYNGGLFGAYLRRDDRALSQLLGASFFETPFGMEVGEVSGVLQSNVGFHIIQLVDKIGAKILGLDDPVNPQTTSKVRDQINVLLTNNKQTVAYSQALLDAINALRERAEVTVFDAALDW